MSVKQLVDNAYKIIINQKFGGQQDKPTTTKSYNQQ